MDENDRRPTLGLLAVIFGGLLMVACEDSSPKDAASDGDGGGAPTIATASDNASSSTGQGGATPLPTEWDFDGQVEEEPRLDADAREDLIRDALDRAFDGSVGAILAAHDALLARAIETDDDCPVRESETSDDGTVTTET